MSRGARADPSASAADRSRSSAYSGEPSARHARACRRSRRATAALASLKDTPLPDPPGSPARRLRPVLGRPCATLASPPDRPPASVRRFALGRPAVARRGEAGISCWRQRRTLSLAFIVVHPVFLPEETAQSFLDHRGLLPASWLIGQRLIPASFAGPSKVSGAAAVANVAP